MEMNGVCKKHTNLENTKFDAVFVGAGATTAAALRSVAEHGLNNVLILDAGSESEIRPPELTVSRDANPGKKSWFGSFAPYESASFDVDFQLDEVFAQPSRYFGGFTRVWGATVNFYADLQSASNELAILPMDIELVNELLHPALTTFEDISNSPGKIVGSASSAQVFRKLTSFAQNRWKVEPSKLAINSSGGISSCELLGSCIQGCSVNSIWFAGNSILELQRRFKFRIATGILTQSVGEVDSEPFVESKCSDCDQLFRVRSSKVFVAAGPIATGMILLNSGIRNEIEIADTATAFGVAFSPKWSKHGSGHNLSQFWVTDSLKQNISVQVYPPSRVFAEKIAERLPSLGVFRLLALFASHFVHPVIFYSKSSDSDKLTIRNEGGTPRISGRISKSNKKSFLKEISNLSNFLARGRLFVPRALIEITPPGTGYHSGASIPQGTITDHLGRLQNFTNIHFLDSSVLPRIELGSITPTVMANSARIIRLIYS